MKKKLFRNYNFEFDKNEKKVLLSFCKQVIKQMEGDNRFIRDIKNFDSIINKLSNGEEIIKLTKEEKTKLTIQLRENTNHIKKQLKKSWIIKKWLMKSMYQQYNNLLENHFSD